MPLAFAMGLVGFAGIGLTRGWQPALASAAQVVYETDYSQYWGTESVKLVPAHTMVVGLVQERRFSYQKL